MYKMTYYSGGGSEYDGGIWEIKETPKSFIFTCIKKSYFEPNCPLKMIIKKEKEKRHCLRDWYDGSYTVYPFQSGTPHVFNPIIPIT